VILLGLMLAQAAVDAPLALPADVTAFIARYQDCEHWAGEEPYDAARRREIARAVAKLCKGIDKAAAKLRSVHADEPAILAELDRYPPMNI
jgi:hypothetical protein